MSLRIVFMGSPEFAATILEGLQALYGVVGVVTQPDRPAGRGKVQKPPPVKILAERLGIPTLQPERLRELESFSQIQSWNPDLIVVAAYGQILRQNILQLPKFGCVNVHASFLPRWRGAAPIQAAILNGDPFTGITIMKMDTGIDTGDVIAQGKIDLSENETYNSLSIKLAKIGERLLLNTLPPYIEGTLTLCPQDEDGATYAHLLKKEDGRLDFSLPAIEIERKVRAFNDWPGTFMEIGNQILKIRKIKRIQSTVHSYGPRNIIDKFPAVSTPDGDIVLLEVQPSGKKWMTGADYLRGFPKWISRE
ncbi:MAG: methionyl-tRNA formyltransferase [Chloroflexi bacterium]|nr:methionyl-tRNA formyltransferase [Chloroflexota bacterium]